MTTELEDVLVARARTDRAAFGELYELHRGQVLAFVRSRLRHSCDAEDVTQEVFLRRTATYDTWLSMRQRCWNPRHARFADYGGRGITIDEGWWTFRGFLADMGERPPGTTLDRVDKDGSYSPRQLPVGDALRAESQPPPAAAAALLLRLLRAPRLPVPGRARGGHRMTRRSPERVGTSATTSGACARAVLAEHPRSGGGRSAIARARAVRHGRVTVTTRQIAAARRREAAEHAERTRLEVIVHRLDTVIDACERAHLADDVDAPTGLAAQARAAIAAATAVLAAAGEDVAMDIAWRAQAGVRIAEVMDAVWEVQDGVLEFLIPVGRGLPDDGHVERAVNPSPPPFLPPAPLRRPGTSDAAATEAMSLDLGVTWGDLFRSAQRIWAWPVGSAERERLCAAYTRAVKQRMPKGRLGMASPSTRPATLDVPPPAVPRGCAHCGQWCERQDAAGVRYCSTEHLLLARITGVGGASQTWRSA